MDFLNPFSYLGSAAGKIVADGWTAAMLGLWNAGLWLLKLVLTIVDAFTTPDLSGGGPGAEVYRITFWIAGALMVLLTVIQLGVAAVRRDGRSMGRVLAGTGQFVMVWAGWIAFAVTIVAACGGLTQALMSTLLHIDGWAQFEPLGTPISTRDISDGTVATVLGFMGIFMVFAAIGHLLVMLTRAGALMVLAATAPISAGGLVSDAGQSWFWKSLRWFIAAAFTPVVMILVLGIGIQMTSGVATGMTDDLQKAIGTAVPGVILICIGCFSPLALFKLLAFVDPGTSSGSALRAGLAAQGGVTGLLSGQSGQGGHGSTGDRTSAAASTTDQNGRSQGESAGEDSTSARFNSAARGLMSSLGGALGQAAGAGMGAMESIGSRGAAIGADLTNQMGVGHNNYVPDVTSTRRSGRGQDGSTLAEDANPEINGAHDPPPEAAPPAPVATPTTPGSGSARGAPGGAGAGAAGGEAAGAAAVVPIVPV
ncbi:MAG TPA: type IV secretion system protein [Dermatophilaceae bacterium]|nr:type IV secretion system protein [Dermatophilaceae bacterium]